METNGHRQPPTAKRANRQAEPPGAPSDRQPPSAPTAKRYTRPEAAAELGVSVDALRRLQGRLGVPGEVAAAPHGGTVCLLAEEDLAALRQARQAPTAKRSERLAPGAKRQPPSAPTDAAAGWREAVAQARAALAVVEAERDRLRSDLAVATASRDVAVGRAESAEAALYTTATRLESLRASVALWYALLRRPLWRLRPLPALPPEVTSSAPALAPPEG